MPESTRHAERRSAGFALVLSLVVMAMLLLLCVGATALLTLQLKVGRSSVSVARARLNALAGARVAVGEIQRLAGPDARVSANAAILSRDGEFSSLARPRLAGIWKGRVIARQYGDAHAASFLGWLSSGRLPSGAGVSAPGNALSEALAWATRPQSTTAVRTLLRAEKPYAGAALLGDRSERAQTLSLTAEPETLSGVPTDSSMGSVAWMVMDENQKARVDLHDYENDGLTDGDRRAFGSSAAARFHPGYAAEHFPAEWSSRRATRTMASDWPTLALDRDVPGRPWFPVTSGVPDPALRHDFTSVSTTLLTDGVNGGLKRDLNLLPLLSDEDFASLPGIGAHGVSSQGWIGEDPSRAAWRDSRDAAYLGDLANFRPWSKDTASAMFLTTWSDLRQWAGLASSDTLLKREGGPYARVPEITEVAARGRNALAGTTDDIGVQMRMPVLNRVRLEYSYESVRVDNAADPTKPKYKVSPRINFVAQLWNPYNVRLKLTEMARDLYWFRTFNPPMTVDLYVNGTYRTSTILKVQWIEYGMPLGPAGQSAYMEPGEIRTFTVPTQTGAANGVNANGEMRAGYTPSGGILLDDANHNVTVEPTDTIGYAISLARTPGYMTYFGCFEIYRGTARGASNPVYAFTGTFGPLATSAAGNNWVRFATPAGAVTTLGPAGAITPRKCAVLDIRLKSEKTAFSGSRLGEIPTLHQINLSPGATDNRAAFNRTAYEWVGWDTDRRDDAADPNDLQVASPTQGFGGSGFTPVTGVSNYVYYTLPLTPPMGVLDLREARLTGGLHPATEAMFPQIDTYNNGDSVHRAFGNSLAHYAVPQDRFVAAARGQDFISNGMVAMDHSWYLNTVLADTWYASSLGDWSRGVAGDLFGVRDTFPGQLGKFFAGTKRLPAARLAPVGPDPSKSWVKDGRATLDAFRSEASRLLVEGGFNVNSTSVRAWRAFLASSRDSGYMRMEKGVSPVASASKEPSVKTTAFPSAEALAVGESDNFKRTCGAIALSDAQLDTLAVRMVEEVRKRGPFLSLGEFLNRRLEAGELGVKGATQAAIDRALLNARLTSTGRVLKDLGQPNPDAERAWDTSGVGNPGWVNQADLLAPLATALTVRGDTYVIRVAGETEEGARADMEVTVRRTAEFIDTSDSPETEITALTRASNRTFGRRFSIVSVRTLTPDEL